MTKCLHSGIRVFERAFVQNDRGYAAAIVLVLLLLVLAMTLLQFRLQRRWVHYA